MNRDITKFKLFLLRIDWFELEKRINEYKLFYVSMIVGISYAKYKFLNY